MALIIFMCKNNLCLDVSVLQQPVLFLKESMCLLTRSLYYPKRCLDTAAFAAPIGVSVVYTRACAAPLRVCQQ
jgi:hypothetical protein